MVDWVYKLLRSSTSKDTFVTFIGNGLVSVIGLIFTVVVARALGPEDFGVFSALIAIAIMLASVGDLGISAALVNFLPKIPQSRGVLVSMSLWLQLTFAGLLAFGVILLGFFAKRFIPEATVHQYVLTAGVTVVYIMSAFGVNLARAERKFGLAAVIQTFDSLIKLLLTLAFFYWLRLNTNLTLTAALLGSLSASVLVLILETKQLKPKFERDKLKGIFTFIKWVALIRIFSVAVARVDLLLLNSLSSSYQAGLFAAASRVTLLFALLVSSLGGVVAPRFSSFTDKKTVITYLKKLSLLTCGVAGLMVLTTLFADQIVNLVFTSEYAEASGLLRLMTLLMIPFLLSIITITPLLYTYNQPKFIAIVTVVQISIMIGLDFVLIPRFQAYGSIIAIGISNIFVLALTGGKLAWILSRA